MQKYPASVAQFTKSGVPYEAGDTLKQPDLARTLDRIAAQGPAGFYEGETALLLEKEMLANGGLITREDLKNYEAVRRDAGQGHLPRLRGDLDAAAQLRRRRAASRCSTCSRATTSQTMGFAIGGRDPPHGRSDEARLRRSRAATSAIPISTRTCRSTA